MQTTSKIILAAAFAAGGLVYFQTAAIDEPAAAGRSTVLAERSLAAMRTRVDDPTSRNLVDAQR